MKRCRVCNEIKPFDEFYRAREMRDGRRSECKKCNLAKRAASYREDPQPYIERAKKWQQDNPERHALRQREYVLSGKKKVANRKSHLKRKYGLTLDDFDELLASQGGGCAICGKSEPDNVDHDHESGRVRGILCWNCNIAVGQLADDSERAIALAIYLARDDELDDLARARVVALSS